MRYTRALLLAAILASAAGTAAQSDRLTPLPPSSPDEAAVFSSERLQKLHVFMRETTSPEGYLGGVTLIAHRGRIVDWRAYGFRDLARREPMQRDDIFRIYSMTKPIASVAVLMLLEDGKLGLDDPVSRYLPELASLQVLDGGTADAPKLRAPKTPITLRMLLTHTAGFPAGLPGDEVAGELLVRADPSGARALRGVVERLSKVPLAADPGTRFGYEAAPLEVLARVVEVVSGEPFDAFVRSRIFEPLRMHDTYFEVPKAKRDRVVDLTTMTADGKLVLNDSASAQHPGVALRAFPSAAGGLYSTAGDYARFCQMLLDGGTLDGISILGRKTVELMLSNHLTMLDPPVNQYSDAEGFGLGGYVVLSAARRGVPGSDGQFGWSGAASTSFWIDPREEVAAVLMLQHIPSGEPNDLSRVGRHVQALVNQAIAR